MRAILGFIFVYLSCSFVAAQKEYPCHTWKRFYSDCKIGYVNPEGKIMIPAQFENATDFSDGRAFVWRYLEKEDEKAEVPLGELYHNYERFGIGGNRETGIIDSTGKFIVAPKKNFILYSVYKDSIALVRIDKDVEIIDKNGAVMTLSYRDYFTDIVYKNLIIGRTDHLKPLSKGYMTRTKQFVSGPYQTCEPYSEGFGAVKIGGKYGYVNLKGEIVIVPQFKDAGQFSNGYAVVLIEKREEGELKTTTALIDTSGRIIIDDGKRLIGKVSERKIGFYESIENQAYYGFLDLNGKVIIPAKYERIGNFVGGLAPVQEGGQSGYIDTSGRMVITGKYSVVRDFKYGTAFVSIGKKKTALINTKGEIVFGPWKSSCR